MHRRPAARSALPPQSSRSSSSRPKPMKRRQRHDSPQAQQVKRRTPSNPAGKPNIPRRPRMTDKNMRSLPFPFRIGCKMAWYPLSVPDWKLRRFRLHKRCSTFHAECLAVFDGGPASRTTRLSSNGLCFLRCSVIGLGGCQCIGIRLHRRTAFHAEHVISFEGRPAGGALQPCGG